jgi:polyisoprenoid-binding protein YceI
LDVAASSVGFETDFGADKINGTFPLDAADIAIDFKDLRNTTLSVTLNAAGAEASFPFAAQAMKGPKVLDTAQFPLIQFASTAVAASGADAIVTGTLTLRGVTRPVTLTARLYQVQGEAAGDYTHLTVALTGALNRSDFGATGWADMVGDQVRLNILARIDVAP